MVRWHHQLNGHEFQQAQGDSEGQGSLVCCSPWDRRVGQDLAIEHHHHISPGMSSTAGCYQKPGGSQEADSPSASEGPTNTEAEFGHLASELRK